MMAASYMRQYGYLMDPDNFKKNESFSRLDASKGCKPKCFYG